MAIEQPMPKGKGKPVFPVLYASVMDTLKARESKGVATYKESLKTWNGRNVFKDLEDELADAWVYATQARMEHADIVERLDLWRRVSITSVSISAFTILYVIFTNWKATSES